jgi:hypothetical protein
MEIPKSFYSFTTDPETQKIRSVTCDLCKERIFDVTFFSRRYDAAIASHMRGKHGPFVKALALQKLALPPSWIE